MEEMKAEEEMLEGVKKGEEMEEEVRWKKEKGGKEVLYIRERKRHWVTASTCADGFRLDLGLWEGSLGWDKTEALNHWSKLNLLNYHEYSTRSFFHLGSWDENTPFLRAYLMGIINAHSEIKVLTIIGTKNHLTCRSFCCRMYSTYLYSQFRCVSPNNHPMLIIILNIMADISYDLGLVRVLYSVLDIISVNCNPKHMVSKYKWYYYSQVTFSIRSLTWTSILSGLPCICRAYSVPKTFTSKLYQER